MHQPCVVLQPVSKISSVNFLGHTCSLSWIGEWIGSSTTHMNRDPHCAVSCGDDQGRQILTQKITSAADPLAWPNRTRNTNVVAWNGPQEGLGGGKLGDGWVFCPSPSVGRLLQPGISFPWVSLYLEERETHGNLDSSLQMPHGCMIGTFLLSFPLHLENF